MAEELIDPRTPRPDPRLRVVGAASAAAAAAAAYVLALTLDWLPPQPLAVAMFVITPVFAALALPMLWARRHESTHPDLGWFATGLSVAVVAMLLQVLSFPAVTRNGGPLGTTQTSNAALYLLFHVAAAGGMALGVWAPARRGRLSFLAVGVVTALATASNLIPIPTLITTSQRYTHVLISTEVGLAAVTAGCTLLWFRQAGSSAIPLVAWVGISQSFAVYDLALNALASERFNAIWWSSLSMRVAAYGVLAVGSLSAVLSRLGRLEDYTGDELDRREGQLRQGLDRVRRLLDEANATSATLQEQLLPRELTASATVELAARYAGAGPEKRIGGDWYDAITLPDGGMALVIGDVEGHDLAAAAVMGQVRAAVHSYALEGHPPSILLERVNRFLHGSHIDRMVSLAYVQLYPQDRLMTIAVAGNPAPLIVVQDAPSTIAVPVEIGPPLGIDEAHTWEERTMLLPSGTDLALFTDGVLEAAHRGADNQPFPPLTTTDPGHRAPTLEGLAEALIGCATNDDAAVLAARITSARHTAAQRVLPVRPISSPIARAWLADLVNVWTSSGDLIDSENLRDKSETALLLLTELVSNALRHGEDSIQVRVALTSTQLRVDVLDTSHRMPALQAANGNDTSGRGLRLVESLSDEWGVDVLDRGKSIWFCLDLTSPPPDEDDLLAAYDLDDDLGVSS